ncbi:MAG: alpha-D-ribose 1-methylphosphonate 5-triphosphate diphosphatase [Pseudomonadota bacterium]
MTLCLTLTGADVLRPDGLDRTPLSLAQGQIVEAPQRREVDLSGYLILPGIVDLHGDAFEKHLAPRRGAMKDLDQGLVAAEAEVASNGITTATLAQFFSWEGGMRGPEFAHRVFDGLNQIRDRVPTDMRAQLRFEISMLDAYDAMIEMVDRFGITYVVLNDHLPHDEITSGKRPPRLTGQALRIGKNPDRHWSDLQTLEAGMPKVPEALDRLCAILGQKGIRLGSHDDHTAEDRAIWRKRGAALAEFPETQSAAEAACAAGEPVILGAPNVVRGGSHKGNASAVDLICMGLCSALASDYHYPSLRRAAFLLSDSGMCALPEAWGMISAGPATVIGLDDRGALLPGLRADIVILDAQTRDVCATIAGGQVSYMKGDAATRLIG